MLENSVLPMGWDSSHETLNMMSLVYKYYLCDLQMMLGVGRHTTLIVNILFKTSICQQIGKKNNQVSVSYVDREIHTLRSTDNAGNLVTSFPESSVYPRVEISPSALEHWLGAYSTRVPLSRSV